MKILLFYFLIALFVLKGIIFSPGALLGGDWSLPFTLSQMWFWFENGFYTWTNGNLFGIEQFFLHSLPFWSLIGVLAGLGITGTIYIKLLLVSAFAFPAFTMYLLSRSLGCGRKVAILGGVLYLTLPFFFNYAAIGWVLVLYSMGILPLASISFIKSVREEKVSYSILTGLLYFLAMIQPQSLVWYPLVFFSFALFLINDKKSFFVYWRSLLVVFFVFLGTGAFWELPFFLGGGGTGAVTTKLGLSTVSLGTWARLSNLNILRGWGSLFNYQYETSYSEILRPLSLVLPFLAYSSLIFLRKKRIIYTFVILSFVPAILFNLGPNFIVGLPFSDLIRDMGRFSVISSFSYVVLAIMVLNFMLEHQQRKLRVLGVIFSILLMINAYPFWAGELFGEQKEIQDIRLRTYQFPKDNILLEKFLAEEDEDIKVLYLPLGGALNALDDKRFYGMYREMRDIFANYSPKPGEIGISDRGMGSATDLIFSLKEIQDNRRFDDLPKLLGLIGVKYVAVRKNVDSSRNISGEEMASLLDDKEADLTLKEDFGKISVFENNNFLPHFYISQNLIYSDGEVESLPEIMSFGDYPIRSGIYLESSKFTCPQCFAKRYRREVQSSKIENKEISERADEVLVKADLENTISKEELGGPLSISLPDIRWSPEDFIYPLVLKSEDYDKWRVRKEPEKLFEKHLFYASKRIAEIEKYVPPSGTKYDRNIIETYRKEIEETIKETREIKEIGKLRAYLEAHRKKIDKLDLGEDFKERMRAVFDDLEGKITELETKRDFSRLVYKLDVPKEGEYEIYVKKTDLVLDFTSEESPRDTIRGGDLVADYSLLGKKYFERGAQELVLPFSGISKNLIDENLRIRDYSPNSIYRISFDYKAPKGGSFFVAEGKEGKIARTDLLSTGEEFRHFEMFFRSSSEVTDASVHLSISVAEERNLEVRRIYQPEIILRNLRPADAKYAPAERNSVASLPEIKQLPRITFVKINPTKYRVKVEGASEPYTLVFSESFHPGWKAWVADNADKKADGADYGGIVASYFDGEIKEGTHKNIFLDRNTFETWGKESLLEDQHLLVNGYANFWYITPEDSGSRENYELIIEFKPQRLFYIGLGISLITLLGCLGYLGYGFTRKRR